MPGNAVVLNFSGGETSPRSRGRFDQPWYQTSARKMLNFIAELQGPARFRPGFVFAFQTRQGQAARILDFEINDTTSYLLEFTPGYLRVRDPLTQQLQTTTQATITSITLAAIAVVTVSSATGLSNGNEVILSGLIGMPQLNNKQFVIANLSSTTFNLQDSVTGALLNTAAYPAAATSGTAAVVYEQTTIYTALDLASVQLAATNGVAYLVCPRQVPQKLTLDAYGNISIGSYVRTNDPFALSLTATALTDLRPMYVGDQRVEANATLTPGATTGSNITFTASANVFTNADIGKYLKDLTSNGYAVIIAFNGATSVQATITTTFGGTSAIAAGSWEVITVETQITLAAAAIINTTLTYVFAGVTGATQVNGNSYYLVPIDITTVVTGQRFYLRDVNNKAIDSSAWGVYVSGGTATPTSAQPSLTVTGIKRGTSTVITFASGAVINQNSEYTFENVGGTTQINGNSYFLKVVNPVTSLGGGNPQPTVQIVNSDGSAVNSTAWSAYTSGGIATLGTENPIAVAFYEGRLVFAGTNQRPDCLFLSMSPDDNGNSQYDNFTGGANADNACFFQLAPTGGSASFISWARGGADYLFIGTFGGPYRVSGSGLDIPITPSSINVRQFDTAGAEETVPAGQAQIFFVQRSGNTLRSIKVINPYLATFESADMCLNAEQIGYSPIQRVVLQRGRPDALWVFNENGLLAGMSVRLTVQQADTLTGWHRHQLGGVNAQVLDIAITERQTGYDQLWVVVQRTVNGATRCYVEVMADDVQFPDIEDFFGTSGPIIAESELPNDDPNNDSNQETNLGSQTADLQNWKNAIWRLQANYVHLDAELSYDGSLRGVSAAATLTPSAIGAVQVEGQAAIPITLTASQAVFLATDVGSEIWVKPDLVTGLGAGRATITGYTSTTQVQAVVTVPFSNTNAVAAGDWFFAVSTFYGFGHLEGAQVAVVGDGAVISDGGQTGDVDFPVIFVNQGTITLPVGDLGQPMRAAVLRAGLPYTGILEPHNLEMGGKSGPAQSKPRNISEVNIRFMNSLGCEYGTSLYNLEKIDHRLPDATADRPAPVFSGIRRLHLEDSWSGLTDNTREKKIVICQRLPLPAIVESLDITYDSGDEMVAG